MPDTAQTTTGARNRIPFFSLFLAFLACMFSNPAAQAADFHVSAGGGVWHNDASGHIRYKDNPAIDIDYLSYDEENRPYMWFEITHPVPILPNLRFEYCENKFSGNSDTDFYWEDVHFKADSYSRMKLKQFDMIAFYQVLPFKWLVLDLGLDVKYVKFSFQAEGKAYAQGVELPFDKNYQIEQDNLFIPFPYTKLKFVVPGTGLELEGEAKAIAYKNTSAYDLSIKASYFFEITPVQIGLEAGYRYEKLDIDQDDFNSINFDADVDIDGPFVGLALRY